MPLSVATWNINSVRLRIRLVTRFLRTYQPDILCLQEIKCIADNFPYAAFRRAGQDDAHEQLSTHGHSPRISSAISTSARSARRNAAALGNPAPA